MLKTGLIQPEILHALGMAGHGSTVLISDGNFPHATGAHPDAPRVFMNLSPGRLSVTEVLEAVLTVLPIERAALMAAEDDAGADADTSVHAAIEAVLPAGVPVDRVKRFAYYDLAGSNNLALVIATGEMRPYANVLLTVGIVRSA
jgi:L-fucose mutarotase